MVEIWRWENLAGGCVATLFLFILFFYFWDRIHIVMRMFGFTRYI